MPIYKEATRYELTTNMRFKDCLEMEDLMGRLRYENFEDSDIEKINEKEIRLEGDQYPGCLLYSVE
ncbi:MAG: hypothetical protein Crog4KO_36610 [Crocinitomicaceae bacterium]